ncbi:hypothetical protein Ancab_014890 [Ancistrocladus abbreviatus]
MVPWPAIKGQERTEKPWHRVRGGQRRVGVGVGKGGERGVGSCRQGGRKRGRKGWVGVGVRVRVGVGTRGVQSMV